MDCIEGYDYSFWISLGTMIIAIAAVVISYISIRYQNISLINSQLTKKAESCNSNLNSNDLSKIPKNNAKFSGILSSIIVAEEILNSKTDSFFLIFCNFQSLIDQFYLQLHTTIRVFLQKGRISKEDIENDNQFDDFESQYQRATEFLKVSIARDKNKIFERLHTRSLKRNKKFRKELKKYSNC